MIPDIIANLSAHILPWVVVAAALLLAFGCGGAIVEMILRLRK